MKAIVFVTLLLCFITSASIAQVSSYTFSQTTGGTYGAALTGTRVGFAFQDDTVSTVALPFTFNFNGTNHTSVQVSSNGFLSFGSLTGTEYNPISVSSTSLVISPFGQDLISGILVVGDIATGSNSITNLSFTNNISVGDTIIDFWGDFNIPYPVITQISGSTIVVNTTANNTTAGWDIWIANGRIRRQLTGTAPNRILTFEYKNFSRFYEYDEALSFKIRLYETSNKIEFVYGTMYPGFDYSVIEVGLKGLSTSDYNARLVDFNNTWPTSIAATSVSDGLDFDPSSYPSSGLTYIWSPACALNGFSITQSSSAICPGQSATLTANGATSYTWVGVGTTSQIVVSPSANTTYTLIGSNGGCTASLTIQQLVVPAPTIAVAQSKTLSCAGESVTLTASGAISYSWIGVGGTSAVTVSPASTTIYTVIGLAGSCASSMTVQQNVTPGPAVNIALSNTTVCAGNNVTLTAFGASTYTWTNIGTNAEIVVTPSAGSIYTVVGSNGVCTTQATVAPGVTPYPNIQASVTKSVTCPGETTTLTATGAASYAWSNGSVTANVLINPGTTTTYTVTGMNGSCAKTATVSQVVAPCLGITALDAEDGIQPYPNPFTHELNIRSVEAAGATIFVRNLLGQVVYEGISENSSSVINTSDWKTGVYLVTVSSATGTFTSKVVKQ